MHPSVKVAFFDYTAGREGFTPFMYADTLNLITTGVGNLIDAGSRNSFDISDAAMAPAMSLPWHHKASGWSPKNPVTDGIRATQDEIRDAWITTKKAGMQAQGGFAYKNTTHLSLDMQGLLDLFNRKFLSNEKQIAAHYPGYELWPADAQLAIHSMSWAMGAAFHPVLGFQNFFDAVSKQDFEAAKAASVFKGGGQIADPKTGTIDSSTRNGAHQIMFQNAANVKKAGGDSGRLFFPGTSDSAPSVLPSNVISKVPSFGNAPVIVAGVAGAGLFGWGLFSWWKGRR